MKNTQKGFIIPLIILIVALIVGGATYYSLKNKEKINQTDNKEVSVSSATETSVDSSVKLTQTPAIEAKNIVCPGGRQCPNIGAISVSLSDTTWNVGGTYRVSWTNSLQSTAYDFYYVEIGSGTTSSRFPNSFDPGFYKVDGSKNYLDITFDNKTAENRILNSKSRNYETVKNTFFIQVMAMNLNGTPYPQDDKTVAAGDSPLFTVKGYSGISYPAEPDEATVISSMLGSLGKNARVEADVVQLRIMAELAYRDGDSYVNFCKNGQINPTAYKDLPVLIKDIISIQGVTDQAHAGLTCVSTPLKYVFGINFTSETSKPGVTSFCIDSSGSAGDNTKFVLNSSTVSCVSK